MEADELRQFVSKWKQNPKAGIDCRETFDTPIGPGDDYKIQYEVVFESTDLHAARLECWITDDEYVAIGIETVERISKRLGKWSLTHGFAAGHEPRKVTKEAFFLLFEAVSIGRLSFEVSTLFSYLASIRACLPERDLEQLSATGYRVRDWISPVAEDNRIRAPACFFSRLQYRPWNQRATPP